MRCGLPRMRNTRFLISVWPPLIRNGRLLIGRRPRRERAAINDLVVLTIVPIETFTFSSLMAGKQDKGGIGIEVCVGKTMYPRIVGVKKERPVRTPDGSRVDFPRGFSSEPIRLGGTS